MGTKEAAAAKLEREASEAQLASMREVEQEFSNKLMDVVSGRSTPRASPLNTPRELKSTQFKVMFTPPQSTRCSRQGSCQMPVGRLSSGNTATPPDASAGGSMNLPPG